LGCAQRSYNIPPEVAKFADLWEGIYGVEVKINIYFDDLKGNTVGTCYTGDEDKIVLDREFWDQSSDLGREELIFHEFGHCLLGLGHDNTLTVINGKQIPKSIMYPYTIGDNIYGEFQQYYREELKTSQAKEE
jgi:hypothetical protein